MDGSTRGRRTPRRVLLPSARLAAVLAIAVLGVSGFPNVASAATPGSQLWAKTFNGPGNALDYTAAIGMSPDGSTVFVTGYVNNDPVFVGYADYGTVAYDASTGAKLWSKFYNGPANNDDVASALAVSRDGTKVFVTGTSYTDVATVAYDASTGSQLWVKRYAGAPGGGCCINGGQALGVSPDGSTVFVTGVTQGSTVTTDYVTLAYDAAAGSRVWVKRYNGKGDQTDSANALGVSPDGSAVYVTGYISHNESSDGHANFGTVAYAASTGAKLWSKTYNGTGGSTDNASALGVSPDGSTVFVAGGSVGSTSGYDFATVAYDASAGARLWVKRYNGPGNGEDYARALGVSPDGSTVFVTGPSQGATSQDFTTVAYDAYTGAKAWAKRYDGPAGSGGSDQAIALGVSPDGTEVFVTGQSTGSTSGDDVATAAYDASSGARLWLSRYNSPADDGDAPAALGVSPDGASLFVTGTTYGSAGGPDFITVAYAI